MTTVTEPVRAEHRALRARFLYLTRIADRAAGTRGSLAPAAAGDLHAFLTGFVLPHLRAEDEVLYPATDEIVGGTAVTLPLRRQHVKLIRLTGQLANVRRASSGGPLTSGQERALRRTLCALQELFLLHLDSEERTCLPILDEELDQDTADALFGRMNALALGVA